jgi:hypothetical protein
MLHLREAIFRRSGSGEVFNGPHVRGPPVSSYYGYLYCPNISSTPSVYVPCKEGRDGESRTPQLQITSSNWYIYKVSRLYEIRLLLQSGVSTHWTRRAVAGDVAIFGSNRTRANWRCLIFRVSNAIARRSTLAKHSRSELHGAVRRLRSATTQTQQFSPIRQVTLSMMKLYLEFINHSPHLLDAQASVNVSAIFSVLRWKIRTWWGEVPSWALAGAGRIGRLRAGGVPNRQMHYQPPNE